MIIHEYKIKRMEDGNWVIDDDAQNQIIFDEEYKQTEEVTEPDPIDLLDNFKQ